MIDKYEIKKINNKDVMYIYINIDYDFSIAEFNKKRKRIEKYIEDFIKNNKIAFQGNIVNIIISGVFIGSILLNTHPNKLNTYDINNNSKYISNEVIKRVTDNSAIEKIIDSKMEEEKQILNENSNTTKKDDSITKKSTNTKNNKSNKTIKKSNIKVTTNNNTKKSNTKVTTNNNTKKSTTTDMTVKKEVDNNTYINLSRKGTVQKIELEEYIIGVVSAEMPAAFNIEALKAQAIISRTYALKAKSKGKTLSDNESNQSYKSNDELKRIWGSNYNTYYNKIKKAVNETNGMYLTYKGNYIEAVFHSTSNGKTENSVNVWGNSYPYLVSVESKYDDLNSSFTKTKKISYGELSKMLGFTISSETSFNIINKTSGGRVNRVTIEDKEYTGVKIRNILGLRSADFDIKKEEDGITFTTRGYGHGVGLSQYGANGYAKNGWNYKKILFHYYPGVTLKNL